MKRIARTLMPALVATIATGALLNWVSADPITTVFTNKSDYVPGETVVIRGFDWQPGEEVQLVLHEEPSTHADVTLFAVADASGDIHNDEFVPGEHDQGVTITLTATGLGSGRNAQTTFYDAGSPSADLDQCANGKLGSSDPTCDVAHPAQWVNGNLGASKSHYFEGDTIPYRMRLDNLTLASHTVTIEWDTTKSGKHAVDYLTTVDRTELTAGPCAGVAGCNAFSTFPIPADPQVTGAGVTPAAGAFRLYGGTITAVSAYSYPSGAGFAGDKSARISVTFTASVADPVLAWGGHIATRSDWGTAASAVAIPGSPYHMRLIDLDGKGGNQDRSLSAEAVIFPGSITIVKDATPNGSTSFPFTASPAPLSDFSLVDDGTSANTKVFANITTFQAYAVAEAAPAGWTLNSITCSVTSPNGGSRTVSLPSVEIDLEEGEDVSCTFANQQQQGKLIVIKHVVNDSGGTAVAGDFTMSVTATNPSPSSFGGAESPGTDVALDAGAYSVGETGPAGYAASYSADCSGTIAAGQTKTCTVTNDDIAPKLHLRKVVVNDNGGTATAADFTLTANGTGANDLSGTSPVDSGAGLTADTWALSETGPTGYTASAWSCVGGTQNGASITVGLGGEATCTITNDDDAPKLHLRKVVVNDNGGTATAADFTLTANGAGANDLSGTSPVDSGTGLKADTWALSETGPSGYTASAWSCVGGTQNGASITLGLGQEATCTITNDDQQAYVIVTKVVVNDNGGTAQPNDFQLKLDGNATTSGTQVAVNPGAHTASETQLAGYTFTGFSGDCDSNGSVTVALGQTKTCTLTNDDQQAYVIVSKVVVNDNGGTAQPNDFQLKLDGNATTSGTKVGVSPGAHTASETQLLGYTFAGFSGDCDSNGSVTVALGETKACTLTNNDIAPRLHLRKVVVNDNGGTATAADFTLTANGTGANDLSGTSPVDSGAGLKADTWALSETSVYGYTASAWSCVGGTQNGSSITLGPGDEATCTITNDDQPGRIVVVKNAKPAQGSFSFTTTGGGYVDFLLSGDPNGGGNQNSQALDAGSYTVKETTQLGWLLTGIGGSADPNTPYACVVSGSGGSTGVGDLNTQTATIELKIGDTVTCVFENTGEGVTRTQGFWATHSPLADIAWFGGDAFGHSFPGVASVAGIGDELICGRPIDDLGKVMGGFWSDIAKKSTGSKRTALDQARMQLLQQLLAAELNASAFGSVPSGGSGKFAQWENALCGTNTSAIKSAQQQAAAFNSAGDSGTFTPGTSADSKHARSIANIPFWDVIKP